MKIKDHSRDKVKQMCKFRELPKCLNVQVDTIGPVIGEWKPHQKAKKLPRQGDHSRQNHERSQISLLFSFTVQLQKADKGELVNWIMWEGGTQDTSLKRTTDI